MKKLIAIASLVLMSGFYAFGQKMLIPISSTDTFPKGGTLTNETDFPLIVIGAYETNAPSLLLEPENLRVLLTYKEPWELKYFGHKGNHGVVVAELKTPIPLLRLDEVLDYFKVRAPNRQLKVLVDKKIINPELFLADVKKILKIEIFEVSQEDVMLSLVYNQWVKGDKYLNIITVPGS
ncbi:MAG: hypothetical protein JWQ14_1311 [Adhaeribacter sp.]|nr:hypothetical protein [Adhaeribacter sp.]